MNFLEKILKEKKVLLQEQKKIYSEEELIREAASFVQKSRFKTILEKPGTHLIAEIKRASPSKGDLRPDLNVADIATLYQQGGVELVSILTEETFFKGTLNDLSQVTKNTNLSALCKDFIIDSYQIREAKIHGADAVLLIARILSSGQLKGLLEVAKTLSMDAVVEIHNEVDLEKISMLFGKIDIVGINHRNLEDFSIDLNITSRLLPKIPKGKIIIAESGIDSAQGVGQFKKMGVSGVLVGESLMKQEDIRGKLKEFTDALR